jgi:hypothetical protein
VANTFGWREPGKNEPTGPRISWVPGDPRGQVGKILPPRKNALTAQPNYERTLALLEEQFYVEISASDTSAPENELKQYEAARAIFDAWFRAAYLSATKNLTVVSAEWIETRNVRRNGAVLRVLCTIDAPIPDSPYTEAVTTGNEADISVDVLTNTEIEVIQNP